MKNSNLIEKRGKIIFTALALAVIFAGVYLLDQGITSYVILELNGTSFERSIECDGCIENFIPGNENITITLKADLPEKVENATLVEYYPGSWNLIDSGEGIVSVEDEYFYKIEWSFEDTDTVTKTYTIISPENTTDYLFDAKIFIEIIEFIEGIENLTLENITKEIIISENLTANVSVKINESQNITPDITTNLTANITELIDETNITEEQIEDINITEEVNLTEEINISVSEEPVNITKVTPVSLQVNLKDKEGQSIGNFSYIERADGKLDLSLKKEVIKEGLISVAEAVESQASIKGIASGESINSAFDKVEDITITTEVFAMDSIEIEEAEIILEKQGKVDFIKRCDNFNISEFICLSNWVITEIPFEDYGNYIRFNVTHFTAYAGGNYSGLQTNLTLWDDADPEGGNNVVYPDTNIRFFADYTNTTGPLPSADCSIWFNDTDSWHNMSWNSSSSLYEYNRIYSSYGGYLWNVSCINLVGYDNLTAQDEIVISIYSDQYPYWIDNDSYYSAVYSPDFISIFNITWKDDSAVSDVFFESNISGSPENYTMNLISGNLTDGTYNFSSIISAGSYYWRSHANDSAGNKNSTDTWIFEISKALSSCSLIISPASPNNYSVPINASCSCTNTDVQAKLYRNKTDVTASENNKDIILAVGDYFYNCTSPETPNYTYSENTTVYTIVKSYPQFDLTLDGIDNNITIESGDSVNISGNIVKPSGSYLELFEDSNLINSGLGSLSNYSLYIVPGEYNITLNYYETQNYTFASKTHHIIVEDTYYPNITILTPLDNTIAGWEVLLRVNSTDLNLDSVWYEIWNNTYNTQVLDSGMMNNIGGDIFNATFFTNDTFPYDNSVISSINITLVVFANDSSNNVANTSTYWVLDNTQPSIQFIAPLSTGQFFNSDFKLDVYLSNHRLNSSYTNITNETGQLVYSNSTQIGTPTFFWTDLVNGSTMPEGNYSLFVYAEDSSEPDHNTNNKTTWFYVDRTPPSVIDINETGWIAPTPENDTITETQSHILNFTCSDQFLDGSWIIFDGSKNSSLENSGNAYWWSISKTEGIYQYTGYCNDTASNIVQTDTRKLTIDYNSPSINQNNPSSYQNISSQNINFRWTASDTVDSLISCNLILDGLVNVSGIDCNSGVQKQQSVSGLLEGLHNWSVICVDDYGHTTDSGTRFFTIDVTDPIITVIAPVDGYNTTDDTPDFKFNVVDNIDESLYCSLRLSAAWRATNNSVQNGTDTNLTSSSLWDADHTWFIRCIDDSGNSKDTPIRSFTLDRISPEISIEQPIDGSVLGWRIHLLTEITDSLTTINKAWYDAVNASNPNQIEFTGNLTSSGNWDDIWNTTNTTPNQDYILRIYANDTLGNLHSENVSFTLDNTKPGIQIIYPISDHYFNESFNLDIIVNDPNLNLTSINATNETGHTIYYRSNNTPGIETTWTDLMNASEFIEGNFTLNISGIDEVGNENSRSLWFIMDILDPRLSSFDSDDFDDISRSDMVLNYTLYVEDKFIENITISNYLMQGSGTGIWSLARRPDQVGCNSDGLCTITAIATDVINNKNTIIYNLTIDDTSPDAILYDPINDYNTSNSSITFNFTSTDGIDDNLTCNLTIDGDLNVSYIDTLDNIFTYRTIDNFSEGHHYWNITCWDDIPNLDDSVTWKFTNDYTDPDNVELNLPVDDANISSTYVNFNWTVSDNIDPVPVCDIIVDGTINITGIDSLNDSLTNQQVDGFSEGYHNWSMTCYDDADNSNSSITRDFLIDRTSPDILLNYPEDDANISSTYVNFNWTSSDVFDPSLVCDLTLDGTINVSSIDSINGIPENITIDGFSEGYHQWNLTCIDDSGNSDTSVTGSFLIDRTSPDILLNYPEDDANISSTYVNFNWTSSDVFDPSLVCDLTLDGTINVSSIDSINGIPENITIDGFSEGYHQWNLTCIDDSGNSDTSAIGSFLIDRTSPSVQLNSPVDWFNTTSETILFNWTTADIFDPTLSCSILIDGNAVMSGISSPSGTYVSQQLNGFSEGDHQWSINCTDDSTNFYSPASRNFKRDISSPEILIDEPDFDEIVGWTILLRSSVSDSGVGIDQTWYEIAWSDNGTIVDLGSLTDPFDTSWYSGIIVDDSFDINYFNFTVYSNDTLGNLHINTTKFIVDNRQPSVQLDIPDRSYHLENFNMLIYNANEHLNYTNYSIYNSTSVLQSNSAYPAQADFNWTDLIDISGYADGNYTLKVYAEDEVGNNQTKITWFIIDKINISSYYNPDTISDDTIQNTQSALINVTCSDDYKDSARLNFSGNWEEFENQGGDNGEIFWTQKTNLPEGNYEFYAWCNDSAGHSSQTDVRQFIIDLSSPSWDTNKTSFVSGSDYLKGADYQFNLSWNDNFFIDDVIIEHNFTGTNVNYSMSNLSDEYYYDYSDLSAGSYYWRSYSDDTAGNKNRSDIWLFDISKAQSLCSLVITPASPNNYSVPINASCSCTNTDTQAILYRDGIDVTASENNKDVILAVGDYSYNCTSPETQNYTYSENTTIYTIVKSYPQFNLTLNGIDGDIIINQDDSVNITASVFAPSEGYIELYQNDSMINNGSSTLQNLSTYAEIGKYNITISYPETYNYTFGTRSNLITVIDYHVPSVNLSSPDNDTINPRNTTFIYEVSDTDSEIENCSIIIDDILNKTNSSINKSQTLEFFVPFISLGNHTWRIDCYDDSLNHNLGISETRNITIKNCTDNDNDGYWTEGCLPADCDDTDPSRYPGASCSRNGYTGSTYDENCVCSGGTAVGGGGGEEEPEEPEEPPAEPEEPEEIPEDVEDIIEEEDLEEEEVIIELAPEEDIPEEEIEVLEPAEEIVVVDPETGEEEVVQQYTPGQITMIRKVTSYSYDAPESSTAGKEEDIQLKFTNKGNKALTDISITLEQPETEESDPILLHPRKVFGWDFMKLTGWMLRDYVENPALLKWSLSKPKEYKLLKPGETIDLDVEIQSPLLKYAKFVDLTFNIQSKGQTIYKETVPVQIDSTQFLVVADVHNESKTVDLYVLISNQEDKPAEYQVEFNINSEADPEYQATSSTAGLFKSMLNGPNTVIAEHYGPFTIGAKDTQLFAYTYEYSDDFIDDYFLKYSLYKDDKKVKSAVGKMDLTS